MSSKYNLWDGLKFGSHFKTLYFTQFLPRRNLCYVWYRFNTLNLDTFFDIDHCQFSTPVRFILGSKYDLCDGLKFESHFKILYLHSFCLVPNYVKFGTDLTLLTWICSLILIIISFLPPSALFWAQNMTFVMAWSLDPTSKHYILHSFCLVPNYVKFGTDLTVLTWLFSLILTIFRFLPPSALFWAQNMTLVIT